ncbi:MAG: thioredoxin family protein [Thiotrichaceae bacterium]
MDKSTPPDVIMLLGTHCPHCPAILKHLAELIKTGEIGRLNIVNLEQHPEDAQEYGVRSVPWVRIGKYELSGAQDIKALRQRIEWAMKDSSLAGEFDYWLSEAQVEKAIEHINKEPKSISAIVELLGDSATVLSTRIGIGVIMEEFAGTDMLQQLIPTFAELTQHDDSRIRTDALHYLGLTQSKEAIPILEQYIKTHGDDEISEVAADSLEELGKHNG